MRKIISIIFWVFLTACTTHSNNGDEFTFHFVRSEAAWDRPFQFEGCEDQKGLPSFEDPLDYYRDSASMSFQVDTIFKEQSKVCLWTYRWEVLSEYDQEKTGIIGMRDLLLELSYSEEGVLQSSRGIFHNFWGEIPPEYYFVRNSLKEEGSDYTYLELYDSPEFQEFKGILWFRMDRDYQAF